MNFFQKHFMTSLAIVYLTALEMLLAFGTTLFLDIALMRNIKHDVIVLSTPILLLQAAFYMGILMTVVFYGRKLLRHIPFPLDGVFGFKYKAIEENIRLEAFLVFAVFYWDGLSKIVDELRTRIVDKF